MTQLPYLFVSDYVFTEWLYRALVFLVISCPCALLVSIPLACFGGIGAASRQGILFKGANYLNLLRWCWTRSAPSPKEYLACSRWKCREIWTTPYFGNAWLQQKLDKLGVALLAILNAVRIQHMKFGR